MPFFLRLIVSHKQPHPFCSLRKMACTGQFLLHALHSVHFSTCFIVYFPVKSLWGKPNGQTSAHNPQPVHFSKSTDILISNIWDCVGLKNLGSLLLYICGSVIFLFPQSSQWFLVFFKLYEVILVVKIIADELSSDQTTNKFINYIFSFVEWQKN